MSVCSSSTCASAFTLLSIDFTCLSFFEVVVLLSRMILGWIIVPDDISSAVFLRKMLVELGGVEENLLDVL